MPAICTENELENEMESYLIIVDRSSCTPISELTNFIALRGIPAIVLPTDGAELPIEVICLSH